MALILAIEPDGRQAAKVAASVRGRVNADLVIEGSAEEALPRLNGRVPDLVLTTALLSPKDDAVLAGWLRERGAGVAWVQTLTIPVLGSLSQRQQRKKGGVLSALRRTRAEGATTGCDPAVFADQVAAYLERAAAERAELADLLEPEDLAAPPAPAPMLAFVDQPEPAPPSAFVEQPVPEPIALEPIAASELVVAPDPVVPPEPLATHEAPEPPPVTDAPAPVRAPMEPWIPQHAGLLVNPWPRLEGGMAVAAPRERPARREPRIPEWVGILESLRRDVEHLRAAEAPRAPLEPLPPIVVPHTALKARRPVASAAPAITRSATPAPVALDVPPAQPSPKARRRIPRGPIQDEWGLFDPEQCGFAALLAKLKEATREAANET